MNHQETIAAGIRDLEFVRQFQELFPAAEHVIAQAKRDLDCDGWKVVPEWISRVSLFDRYVLWLVVAIEIARDGAVSALEEPAVYIVEVTKVEKGGNEAGGRNWECRYGEIDASDWDEIVAGKNLAEEFELTTDEPVDGFAKFWNDTRPTTDAPAPDSIALKAPLRFVC